MSYLIGNRRMPAVLVVIQEREGFESEKILSKISVPKIGWIGSSDYNELGVSLSLIHI